MSKSFAFGVAPEGEILTFKQRGGESLKDAWYRINDSQNRATKKQSTTILLRNFYVGITSWNRFVLDTAINGNFLEAPVWEALNVMENLVGIPPITVTKDEVTLAHIMSKLEKIELEMPSMSKINEVDRRIQGNLNRLDSSMHKIYKTLETLKSHDMDPSRIDKIEDIIETLGTTLSSIKTKKVETPANKEPKFIYVPKVPKTKVDPPIAKGNETVKTLEEIPLLNRIRNETPIGLTTFAFVPRSVMTRPLFESPLKTSCTIEELFDDLDDGSIDTT
jgi:hypothetical protein